MELHSLSKELYELDCSTEESSERLVAILKDAYSLYHSDVNALQLLGRKCCEEKLFRQAQWFFWRALQLDPLSASLRESVRNLHNSMVDRWHFAMLNDVNRNACYFKAIMSAVRKSSDCTVLDIGSGTGILSMMAVKAGAKEVFACELSDVMVTLSSDVLSGNQMSDQVHLLHKLSQDLIIPQHLPHRVSVIVTEIVDSGLLGEMIIPTLRHAWQELLLKHEARGCVIPCAADVYVCAVQCPEIKRQSSLHSDCVGGVSFAGALIEGSCKMDDGSYLPSTETHTGTGSRVTLAKEPYTCERLCNIRGGYQQLTSAVIALKFDFLDPEIPLPFNELSISVTCSGQVDALVTWFDLHLDRENTISSSPNSGTSWEQAVFPLSSSLAVQQGDKLLVSAGCTESELTMVVKGVDSRDVSSSNDCTQSSSANSSCSPMPGQCSSSQAPVFIGREELRRLNDDVFINGYRKAIKQVVQDCLDEQTVSGDLEGISTCEGANDLLSGTGSGLEEKTADAASIDVPDQPSKDLCIQEDTDAMANCIALDLSAGFPIVGLMAAKEGASFVQIAGSHVLYNELVQRLLTENGFQDMVAIQPLKFLQQIDWDLIVCDVVRPQGTLNCEALLSLAALWSQTPACSSGAVVVPFRVTVWIVGVASPALRSQSCVLGSVPTLGLDVARFLNRYQVTHFTDVDLACFPHRHVTSVTKLFSFDLNPGHAHSLSMETSLPIKVTTDDVMVGVAYWFSLHLTSGNTLSTGPGIHGYSGSHYHQAVFLLEEDITVTKGDQLQVTGRLKDGCLDLLVT